MFMIIVTLYYDAFQGGRLHADGPKWAQRSRRHYSRLDARSMSPGSVSMLKQRVTIIINMYLKLSRAYLVRTMMSPLFWS
jgi:hypothetical protein